MHTYICSSEWDHCLSGHMHNAYALKYFHHECAVCNYARCQYTAGKTANIAASPILSLHFFSSYCISSELGLCFFFHIYEARRSPFSFPKRFFSSVLFVISVHLCFNFLFLLLLLLCMCLFSTLLLADTFAYIMASICWNKFNYANTFHVFTVRLSTHRRHVMYSVPHSLSITSFICSLCQS